MSTETQPQPTAQPQPAAPDQQKSNRTCLFLAIILLVVFIVIPICLAIVGIVVLALMGPSIGNIFSNITASL